MRLIPLAAAVCLALLPIGCGSESMADLKADATAAYQSGDYDAALTKIDAAVQAAEAAGADRVAIWNLEDLRVKAMAAKGDAEGVVFALESLAVDYPQQIDAGRYVTEARTMQKSDPAGALDLMTIALEKYPEAKAKIDPVMSDLVAIAKESGNTEMLGNLETLGYIGN